MKKIFVVMLLASLLLLVACGEEDTPKAKPMGQIPEIEIVVPGQLPDKPVYEPPPSEPEEEETA